MTYTPLSQTEAVEATGGTDLLPAGAYVCVITDARLEKSKKGNVNLKIDWDVAEGPHAGHFAGAQYGHSAWLGIEGKSAGYTKYKLDRVSMSNSNPPVTFDAPGIVDRYAMQFFSGGCVGEMPVAELTGRFVGLVVGTSDELYNGEVQHRNEVAQWVTASEARAGKYTDSKGRIVDIRIPAHKDKTQGAQTQPKQQAQQETLYAETDIPF